MSGTLTIEEEKFGTDELGRNTTLLTQIYSSSVNSEIADTIEEIIRNADEEGSVEYYNEDSMDYEIYGNVVLSILSEIARYTNGHVTVIGGTDENQLYKVSMSF